MEKELFKQVDNILNFGAVIALFFVVLMGISIHQEFTKDQNIGLAHDNTRTMRTITVGKLSNAAQKGKTLFLEKCAACHSNKMVTDMTGPALSGVEKRWGNDKAGLYQWIQNSEQLAAEGNPRAKIMINWSNSVMTAFEDLDTSQIDDILAYIQEK